MTSYADKFRCAHEGEDQRDSLMGGPTQRELWIAGTLLMFGIGYIIGGTKGMLLSGGIPLSLYFAVMPAMCIPRSTVSIPSVDSYVRVPPSSTPLSDTLRTLTPTPVTQQYSK